MTDEELERLVTSRAAIQKTCLDLYQFGDRELEPPRSHVLQLLVGAAFSLWRAVFLPNEKRDETLIHKTSRDFLRVVIETNNISFTTDQTYRAWVFGYYLNNALFRLDLAYDKLTNAGTLKIRANVRECLDRQRQEGQHETFKMKDWNLALDATEDLLTALKKDLP